MIRIHSIETFGTHEGPGIRLVVFMQGCNLHCLYCQNPDTQCPSGGETIGAKEILELLEKEKPYFTNKGGITFTGGEPAYQAKELREICEQIKAKGYHIALDTNGTILNETVKKLYDSIDLVLLDIKHIDSKWHKKITGADNGNVLETARYLEKIGKPMWIRYVLVPEYSDQEEYLRKLGQFLAGYKHVERLEILPYHTLGKYKYEQMGKPYPLTDTPTPTQGEISKAKQILEQYLSHVYVR